MYLYAVQKFNGRVSIKKAKNIENIKINKNTNLYSYPIDDNFNLSCLSEYLKDKVECLKTTNYLLQYQCYDKNIKELLDIFFLKN